MRRLPATGINLFQLIYILVREYKERSGLEPLNLSLGNPDGVPPEAVRRLKSRYGLDPGYDYHTYAEDKDLHGFAGAMVDLHAEHGVAVDAAVTHAAAQKIRAGVIGEGTCALLQVGKEGADGDCHTRVFCSVRSVRIHSLSHLQDLTLPY